MMLAWQMNEKTKKVFLVLCALLAIVLIIFGAIYYFTDKHMKKESKKLDQYMYNLIKYKVVKSPVQFKEAFKFYEVRNFYNRSKWIFRGLILLTGFLLLIVSLLLDKRFSDFFTEFFLLFPKISFKTIGDLNEILKVIGEETINGISWFPASLIPNFYWTNEVVDGSLFQDPILYISTIYYIVVFASMFKLILLVEGQIARSRRASKYQNEIFINNLEKLDSFAPINDGETN